MQSSKHMMTYIIGWEQEKGIFKFVKIRKKKSRDFDYVKCIKSNDQNVLVKDNDIKEMWREYFSKLLNEDNVGDIRTRYDTLLVKHNLSHKIRVVEVMKALKQMKRRKATGPYGFW